MYKSIFFVVFAVASSNAHPAGEFQRHPNCTLRNNYYSVSGSCDSYIECKDYIASEMLCPDGLHYNPAAIWPAYPCGYPVDVSCEGRGAPQPAIPTSECPHQYGFFPSSLSSPQECGTYRMCAEGRAIEMVCPAGLAFNSANARCDWPDLVPTCNAESYLGFKCPALPLGENGEPLDIVMNYKYEGNCYAFYSCELGHARLLTCDAGFAFDPSTGHCESSDKVICQQ